MQAKIQAISMPNGDFFVVEYVGKSGENHVILLDMGFQRAYLRAKSGALSNVKTIDLCVLSHIHEDHIGGALQYISGIRACEQEPEVKEWWFNAKRVDAPKEIKKDAAPISVRQANEIAAYLSATYKADGWKNDVCIDTGWVEYDGLRICVLSPESVKTYDTMPYAEDKQVEVQTAARSMDYHVPVSDFDISKFVEVRKEEHLYCIALLLDFDGILMLWMADALPSVVSKSLRALGYSERNPLECEYMTLSHHGSKGNTSMELLSLVRCNKFIVTGNGMNRYNLPDKETLARVIRHYGEDVQFYATSISQQLADVFKVDGKYSIEEKAVFEIEGNAVSGNRIAAK